MSSRGRTLRDVLETGKPLPPDQAFSLCVDLARLLEGNHRLKNVYGGIFPDQVHFEPDGMVQIFAGLVAGVPFPHSFVGVTVHS